MIFATEAAGAVGKHKYQAQREVFEKVWARFDPEGYTEAQAQCQYLQLPAGVQAKVAELVQTVVQQASHAANTQAVAHVISQATASLSDTFLNTLTPEIKSQMQKNIQSEAQCAFGTAREKQAIDTYSANNRMRRFFDQIPLYEYVQIQVYLQVVERDRAVLVQRFNGNQREETVQKDDAFWTTEMVPGLAAFSARIESFSKLPQGQKARWLAMPELEKDQFLETLVTV